MHDTGDVRRRRTSSLVDTEAEMSASTSARDRDSGIRTTLTVTILAPRDRGPRGNLCVASGRGWSGELSIWREYNLSGRPDRRGRRTKRRRDVGRPGQNTGSAQRQRSKASRGQGHRVVRPTLSGQRPAVAKVTALCDLLSAIKGQPRSRSPAFTAWFDPLPPVLPRWVSCRESSTSSCQLTCRSATETVATVRTAHVSRLVARLE